MYLLGPVKPPSNELAVVVTKSAECLFILGKAVCHLVASNELSASSEVLLESTNVADILFSPKLCIVLEYLPLVLNTTFCIVFPIFILISSPVTEATGIVTVAPPTLTLRLSLAA